MNTRERTQAINELAANSIGVYAADHIPRRLSLPAAIVTNLDTSEKPRFHWVVFYIDRNASGTYFDSYGLASTSRWHLDRLERNCKRFKWNKKKLQSIDSNIVLCFCILVCGEYCIMFLYFMSSGRSLRTLCQVFQSDSRANDKLVSKFYKNVRRKYIGKRHGQRMRRVNNFPRATSTGTGFCMQSCKSMSQ